MLLKHKRKNYDQFCRMAGVQKSNESRSRSIEKEIFAVVTFRGKQPRDRNSQYMQCNEANCYPQGGCNSRWECKRYVPPWARILIRAAREDQSPKSYSISKALITRPFIDVNKAGKWWIVRHYSQHVCESFTLRSIRRLREARWSNERLCEYTLICAARSARQQPVVSKTTRLCRTVFVFLLIFLNFQSK